MVKKVVMVDIDDLAVDSRNIREGNWERNKEFVQDIKENGILNPLTVRSAEPDSDVRYAIVCGSQRYNAAIEAGLPEVPCFIEEMDDVTALGRTIAENQYQGEVPAWRYARKIGEMYNELNGKGEKGEIVKIIAKKTGFDVSTVFQYLYIHQYLPDKIIELMKEPGERSETVKELVKESLVPSDMTLSFDKAYKIAREFKKIDITEDRLFEIATSVIPLGRKTAFEVIERAKVYPKKSMEAIIKKVREIPRGLRRMIEFRAHIAQALDAATVQKQRGLKELVLYYVEEGLKRDGFL